MLIQVVHSHPLVDSYNHALFHTIVETLKPRHEVIATDLYREGFYPEMTEAERRSYYRGPYAEDAVAGLIEQLRRAEAVVAGGVACRATEKVAEVENIALSLGLVFGVVVLKHVFNK